MCFDKVFCFQALLILNNVVNWCYNDVWLVGFTGSSLSDDEALLLCSLYTCNIKYNTVKLYDYYSHNSFPPNVHRGINKSWKRAVIDSCSDLNSFLQSNKLLSNYFLLNIYEENLTSRGRGNIVYVLNFSLEGIYIDSPSGYNVTWVIKEICMGQMRSSGQYLIEVRRCFLTWL